MDRLSEVDRIPHPSEEVIADLTPIDFDADTELNWSAMVGEKVDHVMSAIESVDSSVLDVVDRQMTMIADTFGETIKATQALFAALIRLKSEEASTVQQKKERTVDLLRKLEQTMNFIRNV
jgi:hypothetical protein